MKRHLVYVTLIVALSTGCDAYSESEPNANNLIPKCAPHDGRCLVCSWIEAGETRCMVSIFSGDCPVPRTPGSACPPSPVAACDGSTPGYFDAVQSGNELPNGYADGRFYYAKDITGEERKACLAMRPALETYRWVEY